MGCKDWGFLCRELADIFEKDKDFVEGVAALYHGRSDFVYGELECEGKPWAVREESLSYSPVSRPK